MKALAEWLTDRGCGVTGSDVAPSPRTLAGLQAMSIAVRLGHDASNVPSGCDRLIYSPAVGEENPERAAAVKRGIVQQSYPEFIGELSRRFETVCVAGTHGKSTVTGMLGWMLKAGERGTGERQPSNHVICGAELAGIHRSGWAGAGRRLILEACEFRRHFLNLSPRIAVVLGIEWDHVDCYPDLEAAVNAFAEFLRRVPDDRLIIANGDCRATQRAVELAQANRSAPPRVVTFGNHPEADWRWDSTPRPLMIHLPGEHNRMNALAAAVAAHELGLDWDEIAQSLASFPGMRRRLQWIGEWRGATVFDDYAHHPTAVSAAVRALREAHHDCRLRVVFQPHQVRRTRAMLQEFAQALAGADQVRLLPAYGAREGADGQGTAASRELVEAVRVHCQDVDWFPSLDHVWNALETDARSGDVVVLMGAGSIERIADELSRRFCRNHAG
jgi:UDP-N-acetylmuramate--alanine ligase